MKNFTKKAGLRFWVQSLMVLLVVGLFVAACGGSKDPFNLNANSCTSGYTYCSGSGKCCKDGYPYHCNAGSAAGSCYQNVPTKPPCDTYDYCSG